MRLDFSGIPNHRGLIESFIFIDCVLEDRRKKVRSMATFDLFMKHSLELHILVALAAAFITYAAVKLVDLTASAVNALGDLIKSRRHGPTLSAH